ncbi:MAG: methyltransferase domain-containing protein [Candidatus Paceibacterota bacterium]
MTELISVIEKSVSPVEKPIYITDVKPRKSEWPERHINLPPLARRPECHEPEYLCWYNEYANFSVHTSNVHIAKELAEKIWTAFKNNDFERAKKIFEELRPLKVVPFEKRSNQEKWAHMMVQLPGDIGGPNKKAIRDILSEKCKGNVLEAMCGFNSYILPSFHRQVTAMDYCREALERYAYPERKRILFDLNNVTEGKGMPFFQEGTFDNIVICFGFQYLSHPENVFREFNRILLENGELYLVENPRQHYEDMSCRPFSPQSCASFLKQGRFENVQIKELPIAEDWELDRGGRYYLIEAIKS